MIYQWIWSTGVNSKHLIFLSRNFLTSGSFLPNGHKHSRHLSETVKIVFLCKSDVKMMYNSIPFGFPFRITCCSYQIQRQHPWIRKTILQNFVIRANSYSHDSQMVFRFQYYHIIFLFGKIYLSILALISVCTGRPYYIINRVQA